jgi:hypothetical protein
VSSKITYRITVTGVTQFSAATPIATFNEQYPLNAAGDNVVARLHMVSYNSLGTAHEVNLRLSPGIAAAANLEIPLRVASATTTPATLNSFSVICGEDGQIVPRQTGLINNATQAPTDPFPSPGTSYILLFSTTSKDDDGTLTIVYSIGDRLQ